MFVTGTLEVLILIFVAGDVFPHSGALHPGQLLLWTSALSNPLYSQPPCSTPVFDLRLKTVFSRLNMKARVVSSLHMQVNT